MLHLPDDLVFLILGGVPLRGLCAWRVTCAAAHALAEDRAFLWAYACYAQGSDFWHQARQQACRQGVQFPSRTMLDEMLRLEAFQLTAEARYGRRWSPASLAATWAADAGRVVHPAARWAADDRRFVRLPPRGYLSDSHLRSLVIDGAYETLLRLVARGGVSARRLSRLVQASGVQTTAVSGLLRTLGDG